MKTEDEVRAEAKKILNFTNHGKIKSDVGQLTTFNQLGFKGVSDKPDGWYLPEFSNQVAIILETKSEKTDIDSDYCINELKKNCDIAMTKYNYVIGILYNGSHTRAFKNDKAIIVPDTLQEKKFYINKFTEHKIDKELIYTLTARINNCLHSEFGIKNLYHRMIFTACALVAERFNNNALLKGMDYSTFHQSILSTLSKSLLKSKKQNLKLDILLEVYSEIKMNITENQEAIDNFITWVKQISASINSNYWRGEDVMGIFFNEFNRYKKKSENGQVFTPDHITSLMYRILDVNMDDYVLDACCGNVSFLVKSMSNMLDESGGTNTSAAKSIKENHLFGIEMDRELFALACANMLIHKDGKTNLEQLDTRSSEAKEWIKNKPITKVLMNPPYENKYGCIEIVKNVLSSVDKGTECAFILPDKKLEKVSSKQVKSILEENRLEKIIKLPEPLFFGQGITTSIFIFKAGYPQNNKEIFACYIADDGLKTVKNKGRHDISNKWSDIEDYWVDAIYKKNDTLYKTTQWLDPKKFLSYQTPEKPFIISEDDFEKTAIDFLLYKDKVDVNNFKNDLLNALFFSKTITINKN